jgi:hypothetical protein
MKKIIISAIISFVLGFLGGGVYIGNQNSSTINDLSTTINNLKTEITEYKNTNSELSTTINNLNAEIINCQNTHAGVNIEVEGGEGTGDVTGLNIRVGEEGGTGMEINMQ